MKRFLALILILVLHLALAGCAVEGQGQGAYSGTFVLEGRHAFASGENLPGALLVLDGEAELEPGARLGGPAFLLGGTLVIGGEVAGDVSAMGGRLVVEPTASIEGDVRVGTGDFDLSPEAAISGQVFTGPASGVQPQDLFPERSLESELAWLVPEALILAGLAYLSARFATRPLLRVMRAAVGHPLVSAAMGLLAGLVGLILVVIIAYTLILIPLSVLGIVLGFLAIGFGWIGVGMAVGRRLAAWRGWDLSPPQVAALGTFIFVLALNLVTLAPFVGSILGLLAAIISLGAVVLTRFGLREFVPQAGV